MILFYSKRGKDVKQRIITGIILWLLLLLVIFYLNDDTTFKSLIAALSLFAAWEWSEMINPKHLTSHFLYTLITSFLLVLSPCFTLSTLIISSGFWFLAFLLVYSYSQQYFSSILPYWHYIIGFKVIIPFSIAINILYDHHTLLLLMVLITVTSVDSGAYFIGKKYGNHQLVPQISPKKTTEGLTGGILIGGISGTVISLHVNTTITQHLLLIVSTFIIIITGFLGDLFESMIKRTHGIKDSGQILPGHGGLLDRLDSVFSSVPIFSLCTVMIKLIVI